MKISLAIADTPLNIKIEELFYLADKLGFDGIEVLLGPKTFFPIHVLDALSTKYNIPILSIHHPFSLLRYIISSGKAFETAQHFNAMMVVHPLSHNSIDSPAQIKFMDKIFENSKKYNVLVTLENMPEQKKVPFLKYFAPAHHSTTLLSSITALCEKYNFGTTLDTCHLETPDITRLKDYVKYREHIRNIHMSDYDENRQHLALGSGHLNTSALLQDLKKHKYNGIITLELSPKLFSNKKTYFLEIERSYDFIKQQIA